MEKFVWLVEGSCVNRIKKEPHYYTLLVSPTLDDETSNRDRTVELLENGWTLVRMKIDDPGFQSLVLTRGSLVLLDQILEWGNCLLDVHQKLCKKCGGFTIGISQAVCSSCQEKQLSDAVELLLQSFTDHSSQDNLIRFIDDYANEIIGSYSFFARAGNLSGMAEEIWLEAYDDPFFSGTRQYAAAQKMLALTNADEKLHYFKSHLTRNLVLINQLYEKVEPQETIQRIKKMKWLDIVIELLEFPKGEKNRQIHKHEISYRQFKLYEMITPTVAGNFRGEQQALDSLDMYIECASSTNRDRTGLVTQQSLPGMVRLNDGTYYPAWITHVPENKEGEVKRIEMYLQGLRDQAIPLEEIIRFLGKKKEDIYPLQFRTIKQNECVSYSTTIWQTCKA